MDDTLSKHAVCILLGRMAMDGQNRLRTTFNSLRHSDKLYIMEHGGHRGVAMFPDVNTATAWAKRENISGHTFVLIEEEHRHEFVRCFCQWWKCDAVFLLLRHADGSWQRDTTEIVFTEDQP